MNISGSDICSHKNARPRIILAVQDARRKEAYLAELGPDVECTLTGTLRDIPNLLRKSACNGILIDVLLKVKASQMDKVRISDALEAMPSASLTLDARNGSIRLLMLNQKYGCAGKVKEFLSLAQAYQPETIYPGNRGLLHLNAVISRSPEFGEDAEKTATMFITGSGCFLITPYPDKYQPQSSVWLDFVGIGERNPVLARVCWQCPWGVSHNVPGIYVEFESILESQFDEITALLAIERN